MLRKVLTILFLIVFLVQAIGFTFYFNFERNKIKKQLKTFIKEGVPKSQLKVFEFSQKEYSKLNFTKKKEFKIGERFYDIVWKEKLKSGKLRLQCVDDRQETVLFKNLAFLVDDNLSKNTNSPLKMVFSIIIKPMLINERTQLHTEACFPKKIEHQFIYIEFISSNYPQLITPPPNFIV